MKEMRDPNQVPQAAAITDKMKDTIAKMRKYLGEEVNKLE